MNELTCRIKLFITGKKGMAALKGAQRDGNAALACVIGRDPNVVNDYADDMVVFCEAHNIPHRLFPAEYAGDFDLVIAAGWQRMIRDVPSHKLVVFHDSLLPRYRGFAPLVSALLNRDAEIGVTALVGESDYDTGDIYAQKAISVSYPIKIGEAIDRVSDLYEALSSEIVTGLMNQSISTQPQRHELATYSLWRDEDDYRIDWHASAETIVHFINSVGYPFKGASSLVNGRLFRIHEAVACDDVVIVNRTPGKIIFMQGDRPVVVCGKGLLRVEVMEDEQGGRIERVNFRSRFQ